MNGGRKRLDTDDDEERSTEAVDMPWGSAEHSLDDFDPEAFDVGVIAAAPPKTTPAAPPKTTPAAPPKTAPAPPKTAPSAAVIAAAAFHDDGTDDDPFPHLNTGAELGGRYKLEKIIGRGGCGVVFRASHMVIGKKVAVKCLYPQLRSHPVQVERFFREARIAATVEHPNVIKVFDGGDEKETLFLAMELLVGETLGQRLDEGAIPVGEAVELFLKIMDGVSAVHDKGVVHRDLKPENVFLTRTKEGVDGEPKVLDFGVSKLKEPGRRDLTALGTVMGTPYYMAPEQMMNAKDVDARADVYSLGVMLYEAIAGQLPYDGENIADVFTAAKKGDWVPLHRLDSGVTKLLSKIVAKAMHMDPEHRFATVREMHRALTASQAAFDFGPTDVSRTVEDLRSPLADLPPTLTPKDDDLERLANPPDTGSGQAILPERLEEMRTRELAREPAARGGLPTWAIVSMVALSLLAIASISVAAFALLT